LSALRRAARGRAGRPVTAGGRVRDGRVGHRLPRVPPVLVPGPAKAEGRAGPTDEAAGRGGSGGGGRGPGDRGGASRGEHVAVAGPLTGMSLHLFPTPVECQNCGTVVEDASAERCPRCGELLKERRTPARLAGVERRYDN